MLSAYTNEKIKYHLPDKPCLNFTSAESFSHWNPLRTKVRFAKQHARWSCFGDNDCDAKNRFDVTVDLRQPQESPQIEPLCAEVEQHLLCCEQGATCRQGLITCLIPSAPTVTTVCIGGGDGVSCGRCIRRIDESSGMDDDAPSSLHRTQSTYPPNRANAAQPWVACIENTPVATGESVAINPAGSTTRLRTAST